MTIQQLDTGLLIGSAVLLVAVAAVRLSVGTGLPSLLLYLALGLALGESGFGVRFDNAALTGVLGYVALILILVEGGLTTRWATIRPSVPAAGLLATLGTVVSVAVTGTTAHFLLHLAWPIALLLGAAISSTDAAAVFSVLRTVPLPPRLVGMLEAESGFNDAPVVIMVVALTGIASGDQAHSWPFLVAEAALELAVGAVVGPVVGYLGGRGLGRIALPSSGLYSIAVIGLAFSAYGLSATLHGSGFLAVYLAALTLGNMRLPHTVAVRGFAEGFGWLAQIGLFVLLGLLASPRRLPAQVWPAIALGTVLLVAGRPLSVLSSVSWFRIPLRQQAFLSWAGLRGAVPVVLATIPVAAGLPGSERLFDLVFVLVVIFTLIQAPTLPWVARRLGLVGSVAAVDLNVELLPLGTMGADVLEITVGPTSQLHGVEIFELRLPEGANVTLVIRDGEAIVPGQRTVLRHGDHLIVVTPARVREPAEARLRAVSLGGKLVGWWEPSGKTPGLRRTPATEARRPPALRQLQRIRQIQRSAQVRRLRTPR